MCYTFDHRAHSILLWNGRIYTFLKLLLRYQSCFPCGIPDKNTSFLHTLNVGLVVASDPISNSSEREFSIVEAIATFGGQLDHTERETIVILLLLHSVVEGTVSEILVAIGWYTFGDLLHNNDIGSHLRNRSIQQQQKLEYSPMRNSSSSG